jgi:hypothetical protein
MRFKKRSGGGSEENFGISTGQRFRAIGTKSILWEVQSIYRYPWEPFPHVRLNRVGSPGDLKTIALDTLRDQRYFEPEA